MESISLFPLIFFTFVCLFFAFSIFRNKKPSTKTNLPPGSNGWPLIGETFEFLTNPEKFVLYRMKKYSPKVFKTRVFGEQIVVLCGTAGNRFVAANEGKYFTAWRPHSMESILRSSYKAEASRTVSRNDEQHVIRALGFLQAEAIVRYVEGMDDLVQQYVNMYWKGNQTVNVLDQMELMTVAISGRFYLGVEDPERILKLTHLFHDIGLGLHCMTIYFPGTIFYRAKRSASALIKELLLIIKEKKAAMLDGKQMNDILEHMIMNKGPNGKMMSENEISGKILGLIAAAFSSPTSALTSIFKFIGERPAVYENIRKELLEISQSKNLGETLNWQDLQKMKYTWSASMEVMRFMPPAQGTFREAITDFTYEEFNIPKGWKIYWTVSSTRKTPESFPNPEEFVATRFEQESSPPPYTNVPFGGGPRICPGKEYTRVLILTILYNVVRKFKWEAIYPNEKIITSMSPLPAKGLPVHLISV